MDDSLKDRHLALAEGLERPAAQLTLLRESKLGPCEAEIAAVVRIADFIDHALAHLGVGVANGQDRLLADQSDEVLWLSQFWMSIGDKGEGTYLQNVDRDTRLRAQGMHVNPAVGVSWDIEDLQLSIAIAGGNGNVVLLDDREARTNHGRREEATQELPIDGAVLLVVLGRQKGIAKQRSQADCGRVDQVSLHDGDILRAEPREFLDRRDHALVGALRAVACEGRLFKFVSRGLCGENMAMGNTYTVRDLDETDQKRHLLLRDEALEGLPRLIHDRGLDNGSRAIPEDTMRKRKDVGHQRSLVRELELHGTLSQARVATLVDKVPIALNSLDGIGMGCKLDVSILRLAGGFVHDDVDRLLKVLGQLRVASQHGKNLRLCGGVRDVFDLDNAEQCGLALRIGLNEREVDRVHCYVQERLAVHSAGKLLELLRGRGEIGQLNSSQCLPS